MKVVKVFIWLGFTALLAVSIPKVAWVFRAFEGTGVSLITWRGITIDTLWLIPLFVALCIDVLILATTYAVSVDKTKAAQGFMWAFVSLLAALSCYCNLLYNDAHAPNGSIWANGLVGTVTPIVISCVPLFALCYTLILSRIEGKGETLEEKATRLETEKGAKDRIRQAKKGTWKNRVMDTITDTKDVASQVFNKQAITGDMPSISESISDKLDPQAIADLDEIFGGAQGESEGNLPEDDLQIDAELEPISGGIASPHLSMIEQMMADVLTKNPEELQELQRLSQEQTLDEFTVLLRQRYSQYAGYITPTRVAHVMRVLVPSLEEATSDTQSEMEAMPKRKYYMTYEEASAYTGYTISTLKGQKTKGEIEEVPSGKLRVSTLKVRSGNTGKMPALQLVKKQKGA